MEPISTFGIKTLLQVSRANERQARLTKLLILGSIPVADFEDASLNEVGSPGADGIEVNEPGFKRLSHVAASLPSFAHSMHPAMSNFPVW